MKLLVRWISAVVVRFPIVVVGVVIGLTVVFGSLIPQMTEASGVEAFAPDAPEFEALTVIGSEFGAAETVVQVVVKDDGGDVITAAGLGAWNALSDKVRSGPGGGYIAQRPDAITGWLAPTIMAMEATGTDIRSASDQMVKTLFTASMAGMTEREAGAFAGVFSRTATDLSVPESEAGLYLVYLDLPTDLTSLETIALVDSIVEDLGSTDVGDLETFLFARELLEDQTEMMEQISALFIQAAVLIMLVLGFVFFIRPRGGDRWSVVVRRVLADVGLTMFAVIMAIVWMLGFQVLLGPGYAGIVGASSAMTQVIPVLLIGLGVDFAIHVINRYREELADGLPVLEATRGATLSVGVALALGTLTTAVGFFTNVVSPVPALQDFGIVAAVGIGVTFLIVVTFVPSVRLLLDRRASRVGSIPTESLESKGGGVLGSIAQYVMAVALRFSAVVVVGALALGGLGMWGMSFLETEFSSTEFLPEDSQVVASINELEADFSGGAGQTTYVLIEGDVATPGVHNATLASLGAVSNVDGVVVYGDVPANESVISVIASLMAPPGGRNPGDPEFAGIASAAGLLPDLSVARDADVEAIYEAMFDADPLEASAVLTKEGGSVFSLSNVALTTTSVDGEVANLREGIDEAFAPIDDAGAEYITTSSGIVERLVVNALSGSQISSLAISLLAATVLMVITFAIKQRKPFLGVLTIAPVGLVVLWTYGLMAALGIPFGPATATVAALTIGIGIDYSIHVVHRFLEDIDRFDTLTETLNSTGTHTGGALVGSAITTIVGFGILITSSIRPFQQLGAVVMISIGLSVLAAVFVLPAILVLYTRLSLRRSMPT